MEMLKNKIKTIANKENITLREILGLFTCVNVEDLMCVLKDEINDNFEQLLTDNVFVQNYHLFFYSLIDAIDNFDDIYHIKSYVNITKKDLRQLIKPYTKEGKQKDGYYHTLHTMINNSCESIEAYIEAFKENTEEPETFKIMWFIITELKKPDYLFRIFELHPDYINTKNKDGIHLFKLLVEHIYANLRFWDNETLSYYKRVYVMFLESELLQISNETLFEILELSERNKMSTDPKVKQQVKFFINEINSHYELINKDSRITAIDHIGRKCPVESIEPDMSERVDLRNEFTISIDAVRTERIDTHLIDDAYTLNILENGDYELMIHIPDVDAFIEKDSRTDRYMRGLGESVYARTHKTPLIDYDLAESMSLTHGCDRPAITFKIILNAEGKIQSVDFLKTIVRVNYNLSTRQAEIFMKNNSDDRLFILNEFYKIAVMLRKLRKEKVGNRKKPAVIMDEMNIWPDLITAEYCLQNGITIPYKNYFGKRSARNVEHVSQCEEFATFKKLSATGKEILYSVFDIYNRVYYDTTFVANKSSNNRPIANVGNPLREYIALETNRVIKEIIIEGRKKQQYWEERVERDCIEYTETSARIKGLYNKNI